MDPSHVGGKNSNIEKGAFQEKSGNHRSLREDAVIEEFGEDSG